ncbi:ATP binding protein, putative [Ricinus communis]|uniref:ATP binding protein, putative n=1 Tax=Ricinus communis TaxID=3988 RepID=B9RTY5_RICCO|nr:ATP binding protein, putative [Ricinus communis]
MVAQQEHHQSHDQDHQHPPQKPSSGNLEKTQSLITALGLVSRDLPLPPHLFNSVFSIYSDSQIALNDADNELQDDSGIPFGGDLMTEFEDALSKQRTNCMSGSLLGESREKRYQGHILNRLHELEELPSTRGEDLQTKCLLELYGLKLADLQRKVRTEVNSEYWLRLKCASPDKQLFDWGMMRLRRPLYGVGDAFAPEADDQFRKKRDAERLSRLEEEERNHIESRKRKFFAEILNAVREFQLQAQASLKRRKQRNDWVQQWHGKQRQRATRAEKLRLQALKAENDAVYMQLVKESKNERLTTLLQETNKLLVNLGAAVQRQKDAKHSDGFEPLKDSEADSPELDLSRNESPGDTPLEEDADIIDSDRNDDSSDLLEGQRQYNSAIHAIQEMVFSWSRIKAVLYDGRLEERKALRDQLTRYGNLDVLITHYDLIMRDKAFLKKIHWRYMIVDEGHRLKNHECALARTLESGYQIERRLLLTGTPIQNSLQELWSLLNFLLPNIFNSVQNFEEWFNAPFADRCHVALTDEEELLIIRRLHHVIRPFILRRKKDEVEKYLPGKSQVILKCDMSAWQKVYYQQVTEIGRVGLQTGSGKSKSLQNLSMQLRKCCNHPYLFVGDYNMWRREEIIRAAGKFELLDRLLPKLRATGHRVLLFSQMTRLMDILEIYLQLHDFKYLRLDGSTKTEERGTLLKQFNAPDSPYFMFLLSTRAGGLGLNLQTADTVIIFDSDWNPQMDQQAEDRAHRIGQKKEVRVFVLVSVGSIEEVILERAKQKMGIDAKVIQAGLFNTTSTAQDRREMLEEIMRKGTSSLGTDVPSEREINHLAARSAEEFLIFEEMDKERRKKENYRSRLMEEHEVPEWAYPAPEKEDKAKVFDQNNPAVLGKRRRKEVTYADTLSDLQWMKAVESGQDISKLSTKGRRREHPPSEGNDSYSNSAGAEKKSLELKNETMPAASEGTSEDTYGSAPKRFKPDGGVTGKPKYQGIENSEHQVAGGSNWNGHIFMWSTHKKKRSSYVPPSSSSDSRGPNSNGRGNRWKKALMELSLLAYEESRLNDHARFISNIALPTCRRLNQPVTYLA